MPSRRAVLAALETTVAPAAAGCPGAPSALGTATTARTTTETTTTTDRFSGPSVTLPDGPKAPPARPNPLTAESVRAYAERFEEAYL